MLTSALFVDLEMGDKRNALIGLWRGWLNLDGRFVDSFMPVSFQLIRIAEKENKCIRHRNGHFGRIDLLVFVAIVTVMYPAKPLTTKVLMAAVSTLLTLASVVGNGFVLAVLARFKKLRTVPNILTANAALVDLLNAAINMPIYLMFTVLEVDWFKGKWLAVLSTFLHRVFTTLNLASRLLMLVNVYLAITYDLRYRSWKTNKKALTAVVLLWLACIAISIWSCVPHSDIELGDTHAIEYRAEFFKQVKPYSTALFASLISLGAILAAMTGRSIRLKTKQREQMDLPPLQAQARLKADITATKTITISATAYILCYTPSILYAVFGTRQENLADSWFGFFAWSSLFISNASNPVLYFLRTGRFRSALKQFIKDPFGKSDFKEETRKRLHSEKRKTVPVFQNKTDRQTASNPGTVKQHGTRNKEIQGERGSKPNEKTTKSKESQTNNVFIGRPQTASNQDTVKQKATRNKEMQGEEGSKTNEMTTPSMEGQTNDALIDDQQTARNQDTVEQKAKRNREMQGEEGERKTNVSTPSMEGQTNNASIVDQQTASNQDMVKQKATRNSEMQGEGGRGKANEVTAPSMEGQTNNAFIDGEVELDVNKSEDRKGAKELESNEKTNKTTSWLKRNVQVTPKRNQPPAEDSKNDDAIAETIWNEREEESTRL